MTISIPASASTGSRQGDADGGLSRELQLLLTGARLAPNPSQTQRLRHLCSEIADWSALAKLADHHFILPLIYRHLTTSAREAVPEPALAAMYRFCQRRVIEIMGLVADQQRLVEQVLQPLEVPYLLFKGPSLALRYYGEVGLRQCRDVDVLIAPNRLFEVAETLLDHGYRLDPGPLADRYSQGLKREDLKAACRYLNVVTLVSPRGTRFELHRLLDSNGYIFGGQNLFARAETFKINGVSCQVMSTSTLFTYICYHHSRHQWSRLHWLADLDALQRHPSFDLEAIKNLAEPLGLWPTVEACLSLHQVCGEPNPLQVTLQTPQAQSMRDVCLRMITANPEDEATLMKQRATPDFNFSWQIRFQYLCYLAFLHVHPTYADYKAWPLPMVLHPIYYLTRPVRLLWRQIISWAEMLSF